MPRKARLLPASGGRYFRRFVAALMFGVVVWSAWQATKSIPEPLPSISPTTASTRQLQTEHSLEVARQRAAIRQLVAEVAVVCPTSAAQLEQELTAQLATHHEPISTRLRVARASQVTATPNQWLVDPDKWFTPEDAARGQSAEPASLPSEVELPQVNPAPVPESELSPPPPALEPSSPPVDQSLVESRLDKEFDTQFAQPAPPQNVDSSAEIVEGPSLAIPTPEPSPPLEPRKAVEQEEPLPQSPSEDLNQEMVHPSQELPTPTVDRSPQLFSPPVVTPPHFDRRESLPHPPEEPTARPAIEQPRTTPTPPAEPQQFAPPPMPNPHAPSSADREAAWAKAREAGIPDGVDPHLELAAHGCYPSAKTCAKCHEKIYKEWSLSSHAYAAISPMFQKFEQRITEVSVGTVGYFCMRCHSPAGTALCIPRDVPLWQQPSVAREGVTCVACHRVNERYSKTNGERHIVPGDEYAPVYGGKGGVGVAEVIAHKDEYKVKTSPAEKGPGQPIHIEGRYFDQISRSEYCASCHQVAVHPGIKLEVVWEQYRASPAREAGISCQDCHMGKVPGVPSGYECCAIAEIAGKKVRENLKHSNHTFYGPGYSIAHPGVFPFHLKADRWTMRDWLLFDWRAGWGTDEFEDRVADGQLRVQFPEVWAEVDDRYDAREIIDDNLRRLADKTEVRRQVMENGSHVDGPFFDGTPSVGRDLHLHYVVANTNTGHNLPTASLGAQPQLWANVVLIGPRGQRLWETGYTDQYGDVCDIHSRDVREGRVPFDSQLFNLQTMFLITGAVGTDREFFLPVNVDFDQLPFLRPGAIPVSVTNHPPFIRMESRSLAPLGKKEVKYRIPGRLLSEPGRYRLSFRMRSRAEPIYFMDFCRATTDMKRAMNEGILDVHPYSVEFDVH